MSHSASWWVHTPQPHGALNRFCCTPAGQPHKQQLPDECKLYVGNLPPAYDSAMLRQLFEPHARVVHSAVITEPGTGISRGFGFIHIPDAAQVGGSSSDCCVVAHRVGAIGSVAVRP
jgi:hypothetical protein